MRSRLGSFLRIASLCLGATAGLQGQTIVWSGAGNRFVIGSNWVGGVAPGPTNTAQFGNHGGNTAILVNSTTIQDLLFLSSRTAVHNFTYDDGSSTLTLNGNFTVQSGPAVNFILNGGNQADIALPSGEHIFDIGSSTTVTIVSLITGAGHFTKNGAGTLVLKGNNTFNYDGTQGFLDSTSIHAGTLTLDGGVIDHGTSGDVQISLNASDSGNLIITNGGHINDYFGVLAQGAGSTATATVTGSGSYWTNSSGMDIGRTGTGTVNILSGADVMITGTTAYLGFGSTGVGTVNVDGAGSTWTMGGQLTNGNSGTGLLTITNGGVVSATGASMGVGASATGTVTISGSGSQWTNSGPLLFGVNGTGNMTLGSGGVVTNTYSYIATQSGSHGTVDVSGTGTTWTNSGVLAIGQGGTGALTVSGGATVSDGFGYIGYAAGSIGTVLVTGAGSLWDNASTLGVGSAGTGTLTVATGGTVTFAGGIGTLLLADTAGSFGTLNIGAAVAGPAAAGGILNVGAISTGSGTGLVQFNTTSTAASPYYLTKNGTAGGTSIPIYGSAGVTHTAGYTVLNSSSGYTGQTTINGGTLVVADNSALGASSVVVNGGTLAIANGITFGNTLGFGVSGGRLGGNGSFSSPLTLGSDVTIAPGTSPGALNFLSGLTLNNGGTLEIEIRAPTGTAGTDWDLLNVTGTLNLSALSASSYSLKAISLDGTDTQGQPVAGLSGPASWTIATASSGITGFAPGGTQFVIDSSQFYGGGLFSLSQTGNDLILNFTPVPEPSTYALMLAGLACAALGRRRRK